MIPAHIVKLFVQDFVTKISKAIYGMMIAVAVDRDDRGLFSPRYRDRGHLAVENSIAVAVDRDDRGENYLGHNFHTFRK